jgi:hypothetical protein
MGKMTSREWMRDGCGTLLTEWTSRFIYPGE